VDWWLAASVDWWIVASIDFSFFWIIGSRKPSRLA